MEPKEKLQSDTIEQKKLWETPKVMEVSANDATQNGAWFSGATLDAGFGYS